MTAFAGQVHWENFYLSDSLGNPVTGLLYSAMTVQYRYAGTTPLLTKVLAAADWDEYGGGYYFLRFNPADIPNVGTVGYTVSGGTALPNIEDFDVDPAPLSLLANPPLCVITGNIVDLAGRSFSDQNQSLTITFKPISVPQQVGNASLISSRLITTITDAFGNFSIALLQGATVIVEAPALGLRQQFTVPALSNAALLSLLPPIT